MPRATWKVPVFIDKTAVYNPTLRQASKRQLLGDGSAGRIAGWVLAQRRQFEAWLAELSAELAAVGSDDWTASIGSILARVATCFDLDGLTLWQVRRNGDLRLFAEYAGRFCKARLAPDKDIPWLIARMGEGCGSLVFESLDELPDGAAADRTYFQSVGLAALLLIPLELDGRVAGYMLAAHGTSGDWPGQMQNRLIMCGRMLSNAVGRLQAERAVRQEQARLMQLLRAAPDAVVVVRSDGLIEFANDQTETLFGYAPHELCGQSIETLVPMPAKFLHRRHRREYAAAPRVRVMAPDKPLHAVHKSGRLIPVEINLSPVDTDDGPMVTAIVRDITERKRAEEEVRKQRNELARVSRIATVGELAGALAHELNQPLAAILSNAQAAQRFLRRERPDTDQVRQIVTDIIDDDRRAAAVIHQMRRFLKHEEPELRDVEINRLIRDTVRALQSDLAINQVTVETVLAEDLPAVLGNLVQLQQVILNLVLNAIDAMQGVEHVDRAILLSSGSDGDGRVIVAVRDSGPGVDKAISNKIFGPFFTTKKDGMGMGLPITRSIVEAHGGCLSVRNNDDRGCTFSVVLPVAGSGA